jgi:protein-disulfide isomerase-like protein with CxxC motif
MRYDKLYGFYHEDGLGTYLDARFSELASAGIQIECEKKLNTEGLAELWGITSFPSLVLSKNNHRGPILTGSYPGHDIVEWLNNNGVMRE